MSLDKENMTVEGSAKNSSLYTDHRANILQPTKRNSNEGGAFLSMLNDASASVQKEREINTIHSDRRVARMIAQREVNEHEERKRAQEDEDLAESKRLDEFYRLDAKRQVEDERVAESLIAEEKCEIETLELARQRDEKLAKDLDEREEEERLAQLRERERVDKEIALKVAREVDDELLAEELLRAEEEAVKRLEEQERLDAGVASKLISEEVRGMIDEKKQRKKTEVEDRRLAERTLDEEQAEMERQRMERAKADELVARRLLTKMDRDEHRLNKQMSLRVDSSDEEECKGVSFSDRQIEIWRDPTIDVEDVKGGICVTLTLPALVDLTVKVSTDQKTVGVAARRAPLENGQVCAFKVDLRLGGTSMKLRNEHVHYDYSSEVGLLYVYLENLQLSSMTDAEKKSYIASTLSSIRKTIFGKR